MTVVSQDRFHRIYSGRCIIRPPVQPQKYSSELIVHLVEGGLLSWLTIYVELLLTLHPMM